MSNLLKKFLFNKNWIIYILILFFTIAVRLPAFELPIDNDTGAIAYHARLINQGEPLYGTHHPTHHLPAIYYTYALIFRILGDNTNSLQLFLVFWMWLNGLILLKIGETLSNRSCGTIAAGLYILVSSMTNLSGDTAEIELFANVPISLVILIGALLLTNRKKSFLFLFLIGVLGAISFLFKAVYITSLVAVSLSLILDLIFEYDKKHLVKFLKNISIIFLGFIPVIGVVLFYFGVEGLLSRFLLVFQVGSEYINYNESPWYFIFLMPIAIIINANLSLLLIGFVSVFRLLFYLPKKIKKNKSIALNQFSLIIWLFMSIFAAGFSRFGFAHYGILLIPPLSLLFGVEVSELWTRIQNQQPDLNIIKKLLLPTLMIMVVFGNTFYSSSDYIVGFFNYRLGKINLTEFATNHTIMGPNNVMAKDIAAYIEQNSNPDDYIFTWTELAQISYLANRKSSADILWPIYISHFGPPERVYEKKPVYIVVGPYFFYNEETPEWIKSKLITSYNLEKTYNQYNLYSLNQN